MSKPKKKSNSKNVYITIRVSVENWNAMRETADAEERTISTVGARIIRDYYQSHP